MSDKKQRQKSENENEKKLELASAWSLHLFQVLNDKLEKALTTEGSIG